MATYILVDDEDRARVVLRRLLQKIEPDCTIWEASSVDEGLKIYMEKKPQLVFLDVEMPQKNGFECIHELMQMNENPRVVFVTAFNQYAIRAIKASALDYLLKPINEEDLRYCLNRIHAMEQDESDRQKLVELLTKLNENYRLRVNTRVGFELIKPEEILYCEADGNYTNIFLLDGEKHTTSTTLGQIEQQLPPKQFFRIGRSIVINLEYLKSVNRRNRYCILQYGEIKKELPLSLNRVQELSEIL